MAYQVLNKIISAFCEECDVEMEGYNLNNNETINSLSVSGFRCENVSCKICRNNVDFAFNTIIVLNPENKHDLYYGIYSLEFGDPIYNHMIIRQNEFINDYDFDQKKYIELFEKYSILL